MITFIIKIILGLLVSISIIGCILTYQVEHSEEQKAFQAGIVPTEMPNGLYSGTVPNQKVSWLGKKFDSMHSTGINIFQNGSTTEEKYAFKTSVGKSIRNNALSVIVIDYNISSNPFWLRPVLDEIVEVAPGEFLGKLNVHIIPGFPFTLSYFTLTKAE